MILLLEIKNKKRRKIRPSFNAVSAANSRQIARNCDKPPPSSPSRSRALDGKRWKREGGRGEGEVIFYRRDRQVCIEAWSREDSAGKPKRIRNEPIVSRDFYLLFSFLCLSLSADFHGSLTHRKIYSNDTRYAGWLFEAVWMFLEKVWSLDCRSSIGIEILNFLEFLFTIPLLTFYILYLICCISYILYILVLFISILFIILYSLIFHIL